MAIINPRWKKVLLTLSSQDIQKTKFHILQNTNMSWSRVNKFHQTGQMSENTEIESRECHPLKHSGTYVYHLSWHWQEIRILLPHKISSGFGIILRTDTNFAPTNWSLQRRHSHFCEAKTRISNIIHINFRLRQFNLQTVHSDDTESPSSAEWTDLRIGTAASTLVTSSYCAGWLPAAPGGRLAAHRSLFRGLAHPATITYFVLLCIKFNCT
jgi:hypothetical protein